MIHSNAATDLKMCYRLDSPGGSPLCTLTLSIVSLELCHIAFAKSLQSRDGALAQR